MWLQVRPTRFAKYPREVHGFGYALPVEIEFASGRRLQLTASATPISCVEECVISADVVKKAGGCKSNKSIHAGSKNDVFLPITIRVQRSQDRLETRVFARVTDLKKRRLIISLPVLESLGDVLEDQQWLTLHYPKVSMFAHESLDSLTNCGVLVLGPESDSDLLQLRLIETSINARQDLRAWLLRDYHDNAGCDVVKKLVMMAAASRFIIIHDAAPSGHLTELPVVYQLSTPIAIIRPKGVRSSWVADSFTEGQHVRVFEYPRDSEWGICIATSAACAWATSCLIKQQRSLDTRYPWRASQIALADEFDGLSHSSPS